MSLFTEAIDRLRQYNLGIYNASSNLFGLSGVGGMAANWSRHSKDVATVGEGVASLADAATASQTSAAGSAIAAGNSATAAHTSEVAAAGSASAAAGSATSAAGSATAAAGSAGAAAGSASAAASSATWADQLASAVGGTVAAVRLTWDTATADADPGNGKVRLNSTTVAAATALYVDNVDAAGASITTVLDRWTASTNTVKGTLRIAHRTDATKWLEYQVTGAVVDGTGYRKITVTGGTGPGGLASGDPVAVGFSRAGDAPTSFAAGTAAAPGWAVTGDSNTGLAQISGADTISLVAGGIETARAVSVASAVNRVEMVPSISGGVAGLRAAGADSSVNLGLWPKGTGWLVLYSADAVQAVCLPVAGANRYLTFSGSNGGNPTISTNAGALNLTSATGQVLINGAAIGSGYPAVAKSAAYTVAAADAGKLIVATGTWTLGLPAAASAGSGFTIAIKNTGTGLITVDPNGSELVDQAPTGLLSSRQSVILVCDGAGWNSIGGIGFSTAQQWSATAISGGITLSEGNLRAVLSSNTSSYQTVRGVNALPDGSTYWEVACLSFPNVGGDSGLVGVVDASFTDFANRPLTIGAYQTDGTLRKSAGGTAFGASWGGGDTMMFGFKRPPGGSGSLWIGKNGVWQGGGDPVSGTNPAITGITQQVFPMASANLAPVYRAHFSLLEFVYAIPSGFFPLA